MNNSKIEQMICGKWKLVQEIGQGAYGVVYRAVGPAGEQVAVKVCRRDAVENEYYERELRGAKLFRSIPPQEGLVRMRELVETDWGFYTVLDLADDEFDGSSNLSDAYRPKTLARVIAGEKALPLKACVKLAISLTKGLVALQRNHLLHRDIKPGNVVYVGGHPVLSDLGLLIEEANAVSLVGTPGYVPPERFTDAASDIYSLGLTLKAASFGRQVEELDKGPAMEADTGAAYFPAWWRILNKATDPIASRRYQSAKALLNDLKLLHLRIALPIFSWKVLLCFALAIVGLVALIKFTHIGKTSDEASRKVAENVLADFIDMRTKEDMPDIKRGEKSAYVSMLNMLKEELASQEEKIKELEVQIADNEKRIKEAEERGDKREKEGLEYDLPNKKERLKSMQERKAELERDIPIWEEKIQKKDDEIRQAEEELLKLKKRNDLPTF